MAHKRTWLMKMIPVSAGLLGVGGTVNHGDEGVYDRASSRVPGRVKLMPVAGRDEKLWGVMSLSGDAASRPVSLTS